MGGPLKEEHSLAERKRIAVELQRRDFWKAVYVAAVASLEPDPAAKADFAVVEYDKKFKDF